MLKKFLVGSALIMLSGQAVADVAGIGRAGFLAGYYDADFSGGGQAADQSQTSMGVFGGYTLAYQSFFADLGLEYQSTSNNDGAGFDRTDVLPSVGVFLPRGFNLQLGYRFGFQGEELFDDTIYKETGPFAGVGFPSFALGADYELSPSVGFNLTEFDFGTFEGDFLGISVRAAVSKPASPHTFGVRIQRFQDRESDFKFIEHYVHLFYQVSFAGFSR